MNPIKQECVPSDIRLGRMLAYNNKKVRDAIFIILKKWLLLRTRNYFEFKESERNHLWNGLFYGMLISNNSVNPQTELAASIADMVHCFESGESMMDYVKHALETISHNWDILQPRKIYKFEMLLKEILRHTFIACKDYSWNITLLRFIVAIIDERLSDRKTNRGFIKYLEEIFWEEFFSVSEGEYPIAITTIFIKPFIKFLSGLTDHNEIKHTANNIFRYFILRTEVGLNFRREFEDWKNAGFPCLNFDIFEEILENDHHSANINFKEEVIESEITTEGNETTNSEIDDLSDDEMFEIFFNAPRMLELIDEQQNLPTTTPISRTEMTKLCIELEDVMKGSMPLGVFQVKRLVACKNKQSKDAMIRYLLFEVFDREKTREEEEEETKSFDTKNFLIKREVEEEFTEMSDCQLKKNFTDVKSSVPKILCKLNEEKLVPIFKTKKRVTINIECNTVHYIDEYIRMVRENPAIPFDANKKSLKSALKHVKFVI